MAQSRVRGLHLAQEIGGRNFVGISRVGEIKLKKHVPSIDIAKTLPECCGAEVTPVCKDESLRGSNASQVIKYNRLRLG